MEKQKQIRGWKRKIKNEKLLRLLKKKKKKITNILF